ncbi:MAG: hypothetical protein ABH829_00505 [archaeon]
MASYLAYAITGTVVTIGGYIAIAYVLRSTGVRRYGHGTGADDIYEFLVESGKELATGTAAKSVDWLRKKLEQTAEWWGKKVPPSYILRTCYFCLNELEAISKGLREATKVSEDLEVDLPAIAKEFLEEVPE